METIQCIKTRRSIRSFTKKEVPDELLEKCIDAAQHAPFCGKRLSGVPTDYTPWEFIVVKDCAAKQKLASVRDETNKFFTEAPALIVVCVDKKYSDTRWVEDGSTAAQNLLLAAHALGLGGVWLCAYSNITPAIEKVTREVLNLPANIQPVVMVALGYSNEKPKPKKLRTNAVHYEKW